MEILEPMNNQFPMTLFKLNRVDLNEFNIDMSELNPPYMENVMKQFTRENEAGVSLRDYVCEHIQNKAIKEMQNNIASFLQMIASSGGTYDLGIFAFPFVWQNGYYVLAMTYDDLYEIVNIDPEVEKEKAFELINHALSDTNLTADLVNLALRSTGLMDGSYNKYMIGCYECHSYRELDALLKSLINIDVALETYKMGETYRVFFFGSTVDEEIVAELTDDRQWLDNPDLQYAYMKEHGKDLSEILAVFYNEKLPKEEPKIDKTLHRRLEAIIKKSLEEVNDE